MNAAAIAVLQEIPEICLAYGISDEFRFHITKPDGLDSGLLMCNVVSYSIAHAACSIGEKGNHVFLHYLPRAGY